MFDRQYKFRGRHAFRVAELTKAFDELGSTALFKRNVDVYVNAPLVGFLYGRRAEPDNSKRPNTNQDDIQSIMADRVVLSSHDLQFDFWLIMLLDEEYEPDEEKRIDKAFRGMGQNPDDEERFDSYVRGGVDVLYEKLMEGEKDPKAYVSRLQSFLDDFNNRFNKQINKEEILNLSLQN